MYDLLDKNGVKHLWSLITEAINQVAANIPTKVSELLNDSEYQTEEEVRQAITDALSSFVGIDYEVVETLPETGEKGIIYLMPESYNEDGSVKTYYEYIWLEGHWERLGTTDIDLTNYATKDYVDQAIAENPGYKVYHLTNPGLNSEEWEYDFVEGDKETLTQIFNSIKNGEELEVMVDQAPMEWGKSMGSAVKWNLNNEYDWGQNPPTVNGYRLNFSWRDGDNEYNMSAMVDLEGNVTSEKWEGNYYYNQTSAGSVRYDYYDYDTSQSVNTTVSNELDKQRTINKSIKQPDYKTVVVDGNNDLTTVIGGSKNFTNTIYYGLIGGTSKKGTYLSSEGTQYYQFGNWMDHRTIIGEYTDASLARQALQNKSFYVCVEVDGEYRTAQGWVSGYEWQINTTDTSEGSIKYIQLDTGYATVRLYQANEDITHVITGLWISDTPFEVTYNPIGSKYIPVDNQTIIEEDGVIKTCLGGYQETVSQGDLLVSFSGTPNYVSHSSYSDSDYAVTQRYQELNAVFEEGYDTTLPLYTRIFWSNGTASDFEVSKYGEGDSSSKIFYFEANNRYVMYFPISQSLSVQLTIKREERERLEETDAFIKRVEIRSQPWSIVYHPIDPNYIPVDGTTIEVENGKLKANVPDIDLSDYPTKEELASEIKAHEQPSALAAIWDFTRAETNPNYHAVRTFPVVTADTYEEARDALFAGKVVKVTKNIQYGQRDFLNRVHWRVNIPTSGVSDSYAQDTMYISESTFYTQFTPNYYYILVGDALYFSLELVRLAKHFVQNLPWDSGWVEGINSSSLVGAIQQLSRKIPDVSNFATKDEVAAVESEIPSIEGLATTEQVNRKQDKLANGSTENNALVWDADSESWVPGVIESGSSYPEPPAANGNYQLLAIVNNGEVEYSWVTLSGVWQYPLQTGNNLALYQGSVINQYNNNLEII